MKKIISISLAVLLLVSCFMVSASAAKVVFTVRIEGVDGCLYNGERVLQDDTEEAKEFTAADVLAEVSDKEDDINIVGAKDGYITEVNGLKAANFGGYDGWYYCVNGKAPDEGIADYKLKSGDSIVLYYGDYPCQIPELDLKDVENGVIKVQSYDTVWVDDGSGNWIPNSDWAPVIGATLTLNGNDFTSDENGIVTFDRSKFEQSDTVNAQISKCSEKGCPQVLRFAPGYNFGLGDVPGEDNTTALETTAPVTETQEVSETMYTTTPEPEETTVEPTSEAQETTAEPTSEAQETTVEPTSEAQETTAPAKEDANNNTEISVPTSKTLYVGQTYKINAKIDNPVGNTSYISNRKSIASVNSKGKVTARKKGTATITVKNNKVSVKIKITVKNPRINRKKVTLKKGHTFKIKITGKAGKQTYKSSKKSVVKVSKSGKITAKKKGKAVITVKTNGSIKFKIKVTVKK